MNIVKVLAIDQNSIQETARLKWNIFSQYRDISLSLLVPRRWKENYRDIVFRSIDKTSYKIYTGDVVWPGYENRSFYLNGLGKAIRETQPDIIFLLQEPYSLFALQTLFFKKLFVPKAKIIFYTWDNLTWQNKYPYRPSFIYEIINKIMLKNCDGGIAANIEASEVLRKKGFTKPIEVIYYPLDLNFFNIKTNNSDIKTRYCISLEGMVIGYVGRLLKQKGIDLLFQACACIQAPITLLIIGDGPDKQKFQKLAASLGLQKKIHWINTVQHHEIPELFRMIDILVLPSRSTIKWKEQFGRVLVEAMACGAVPIGSSSGAIPEVIGDAGLIFPEDNASALSEAIQLMISNKTLFENLRTKCLIRVNQFSSECFTKSLMNFLLFIQNNVQKNALL